MKLVNDRTNEKTKFSISIDWPSQEEIDSGQYPSIFVLHDEESVGMSSNLVDLLLDGVSSIHDNNIVVAEWLEFIANEARKKIS